MREITLTNSDIKALVDDEDYEWLSGYKWKLQPNGYIMRWTTWTKEEAAAKGLKTRFRGILMHREIKGFPDDDIDHRNRIRHDNQRDNLRVATRSQNLANSENRGKSQYRGVSYWNNPKPRVKKWIARIQNRPIGYFLTEVEAALAYDREARLVHGEFARLNFPLICKPDAVRR